MYRASEMTRSHCITTLFHLTSKILLDIKLSGARNSVRAQKHIIATSRSV